ncbi:AbrB family transcriptional regulator [Lactiplantibacillus daoliensis]|uniref:AbrB family transcriptional regulator n=1 Tax=Lactiplantibacillus daoliensis TaxID=2559916 RepID=UPI0010F7E627
MIAIPAAFKFPVNAEYQPVRDESGIISFVPVSPRGFSADSGYDLKTALRGMLIKDNGTIIGKENVW